MRVEINRCGSEYNRGDQKRIAAFYAFGVNWLINTPVSLVAYEDTIEIKVYLDSLVVPYAMIVDGPVEVGKLKKSIRIKINVPGLPKVLTIHGNKKVLDRTKSIHQVKTDVGQI